jgi:hypothetical protein
MQSGSSLPAFQKNVLPQFSGQMSKSSKPRIMPVASLLGSHLTLMVEGACFSGTLVNFYLTIWRHIQENSTCHSHCRHCHENITSRM